MAPRTLSPEAVQRALAFTKSGAEHPLKIVEQRERIEQLRQHVDERMREVGCYREEEVKLIISAKKQLDVLYGDLAEGVERVRWCDLPEKQDLAPDDILREAVYSTEAVYGADGVETLATYLDTIGYDALTKRLAARLLAETRPLLEEVLPVEGHVATVLADPRCLGATSDEEARRLVSELFVHQVHRDSPEHVKRAMVAYIEFGLCNYVASIKNASFAHNEKNVPGFAHVLYAADSTAAELELLRVERRKAEILIELLKS